MCLNIYIRNIKLVVYFTRKNRPISNAQPYITRAQSHSSNTGRNHPFPPAPCTNIPTIPSILNAVILCLTSAFTFCLISLSNPSIIGLCPIACPYISSTSNATSTINSTYAGRWRFFVSHFNTGERVASSRFARAGFSAERCLRVERRV